ncbi:MAG: hypothetical protein ACRES6_08945 [Steroidobacteraceae bacterium]
MDAATLNARVYAGRAQVAARLGTDCALWRPVLAGSPFTRQIGTLKAAFNAADPQYAKPNLYGKPVWFGDLDGRITRVGDYLVRASDGATWFLAAQQPLLPIACIECDRLLSVYRPQTSAAPGTQPYGGAYAQDDEAILGGTAPAGQPWPASILQGKRLQPSTPVPGTVKEVGWEILLPPSVPVTILASDLMIDDLGRRYAVEGAELTDLGWRIQAEEAHP